MPNTPKRRVDPDTREWRQYAARVLEEVLDDKYPDLTFRVYDLRHETPPPGTKLTPIVAPAGGSPRPPRGGGRSLVTLRERTDPSSEVRDAFRAAWLRDRLSSDDWRPGRDCVYFVEAVGTGLVKIGCTADPLKRLRALRAEAATESEVEGLSLLGVVAGYMHEEAQFQNAYEADRSGWERAYELRLPNPTEWFMLPRRDRVLIRLYASWPELPGRRWVSGPCRACGATVTLRRTSCVSETFYCSAAHRSATFSERGRSATRSDGRDAHNDVMHAQGASG